MAGNVYEFRYTVQEVTSAQRMRFLRSTQLKILAGMWLLTVLYIAAPLLLPGIIPANSYSSWSLVLTVVIAYAVTMLVLIFVTPTADFFFNRFWHTPLVLRFNEKQMRVSVVGKPGGLRLDWGQIERVDENKHVYIISYGAANKYLILPKSAMKRPGAERRFRDYLATRTSRKAVLTSMPEQAESGDDEV